MSGEGSVLPGRMGFRTAVVAATGLGSGAVVTGLAAYNVGSENETVKLAVIGGTAIRGISALVTALSPASLRDRRKAPLPGTRRTRTRAHDVDFRRAGSAASVERCR